MNPDLEALILALDAIIEARNGAEAEKLQAKYDAKLEEVLARFPSLSRDRLERAVDFAYRKWKHGQGKKGSPMSKRA